MYVAPASPHNLIQERYPGDAYKILVCCQLLNQTSRKQLEKVIDDFFERWPTAQDLASAKESDIVQVVRPLGFYNRRSKSLKRFANDFLSPGWSSASELYGCGKYASDAYEIFIKGRVTQVEPNDHALNDYHSWYLRTHTQSEVKRA